MEKCVQYFAILILSCAFGCAHHDDVRTGSAGMNFIVIMNDDPKLARKEAYKQADHFCDQTEKVPEIIFEKKHFIGGGKEEAFKDSKAAAQTAKMFSPPVLDSIIEASVGVGYSFEMQFKCQ